MTVSVISLSPIPVRRDPDLRSAGSDVASVTIDGQVLADLGKSAEWTRGANPKDSHINRCRRHRAPRRFGDGAILDYDSLEEITDATPKPPENNAVLG